MVLLNKHVVHAKRPLGPYSDAVRVGDLIFVAGQLALDEQGKPINADIRTQTRHVLENIKRIVEMAGSSIEKIVKTTVYLATLDDYPSMNEVYREFFTRDFPARATVQVARLIGNLSVEIEAVATVCTCDMTTSGHEKAMSNQMSPRASLSGYSGYI